MTNLRLSGFITLGLALTMGIILWRMHETRWALLLFSLGALQVLILVLNWNKESKRHKRLKK